MSESIEQKLSYLYGEEKGKKTALKLEELIQEAKTKITLESKELWDEKDVFLITYADSFQEEKTPTLKTLQKFLDGHFKGVFKGIHILPFYPYSSDRGFSVSDYYQVKKEFGNWDGVQEIGKNYKLMADLVLNHVSVKHEWFRKFLEGDEKYLDYFIHFDKSEIPEKELKKVYRPRPTPLLTPFKTAKGERWVWTTFSVENTTDQVDLNYKNPEVLLEIVKIITFFLQRGIRFFRLDSTPYIWKVLGTECKSLPQTHAIVGLLHDILNLVCPQALILTQSSVSFEENLSYLDEEKKESDLIYNFALPPVLLDALYNQNSRHLNEMTLKMRIPPDVAFFNILAVHDGIGVNGAKGFLSELELNNLYKKIEEHGGKLSYRNLPDGSRAVIELVITWWSALNPSTTSTPLSTSSLRTSSESFDLQLRKFITSHAIVLSLAGIPAVYYLSLFGGENDIEFYSRTKIKRDLIRTNYNFQDLEMKLANKNAKETKVLSALLELIKKRKSLKAFHPNARQDVLSLDKRVFALLRGENEKQVLALHNLSDQKVNLKFKDRIFNLEPYSFFWEQL